MIEVINILIALALFALLDFIIASTVWVINDFIERRRGNGKNRRT